MIKIARSRLSHSLVLALALAGGWSFPLQARETTRPAAAAPSEAPRPWLYENSDVPIDTAWL
ncbi:MAG: hypothetical protein B7Z20_02935, partial [Sphingobium sp. 32-64-5]